MNWIVLIGPPAVGKTTLARQLESNLPNSKIFSFDDELDKSLNSKNSKELRSLFLSKIVNEKGQWEHFIIDDTSHLQSIQKSYKTAATALNIRLVFIYISAEIEQISGLIARNSSREFPIKDEFIMKLVKHFTVNQPKLKDLNLIEFNYTTPPKLKDLIVDLKYRFNNFRYCDHLSVKVRSTPDTESNENFFNKLNKALNVKIHQAAAFKDKNNLWDGTKISQAKRKYINKIKVSPSFEYELKIEELVLDFTNKYLL